MLKNKKIVVVGGTSGIGHALARQALDAGAEVVVASRSPEKLAAALAGLGPGARAEQVDAGNDDSVAALFDRIGPFDHLAMTIKSALSHHNFLAADLVKVQAAFDIKVWGQYRLARHAAAAIRPGGSIVFTSGVASRRATPGMSAASAMNGAIEALAQAIALELAPIRVNTVSPGLIDAGEANPARRAALQELARSVPLRRMGWPDEVASAYLHLFGSAYATGSVIVVDGGVAC